MRSYMGDRLGTALAVAVFGGLVWLLLTVGQWLVQHWYCLLFSF